MTDPHTEARKALAEITAIAEYDYKYELRVQLLKKMITKALDSTTKDAKAYEARITEKDAQILQMITQLRNSILVIQEFGDVTKIDVGNFIEGALCLLEGQNYAKIHNPDHLPSKIRSYYYSGKYRRRRNTGH